MGLLDNMFPGRGQGMLGGQQPVLPRVPFSQNPMITTAALSLLGGRNLNEGLANVAQSAPAGMVAKTAMQRDMYSIQEKQAEDAKAEAKRQQMNEVMKAWPGLSPEHRALFSAQPELFGQYAVDSMKPQETYRPLTDPAERAQWGIAPEDSAPYQISPDNKVSAVGGASTNISMTDNRLTEGQAKSINFYSRGRAADAELGKVEKTLTELDQSLWSGVPIAGNYATTAKYQTAQRAAREFLAMVLRPDTGAAVTDAEFELYGPMYIPAPGDSEAVLAAKRRARDRAMDALKDGLGDKKNLADDVDNRLATEAAESAPPPGVDVDPADWDFMTPEQRALFAK